VQLHGEVTVGVPDSPERNESTGAKARLLPKLSRRRGLGALARLDPATRELPEAGKETGRWSTLDEPSAAVGEDDDCRPDVRPATAGRAPR
jgi:hypothetical protein